MSSEESEKNPTYCISLKKEKALNNHENYVG